MYFTLLFISLSVFCLSGCLEHNYEFKVHPNGSIDCKITIRGDLVDMMDGTDLFPDTTLWQVKHITESDDRETTHIIEAFSHIEDPNLLSSLFLWSKNPADSLFLKKDFKLDIDRNILYHRWRFYGILSSRQFNNLYGDIWDFVPEECRLLEDNYQYEQMPSSDIDMLEKKFALGIIQWNKARYERIFERIFLKAQYRDSSLLDTSSDEYTIARSGWFDDLHRYLNQLDVPQPETVNLDWWKELRPQFLGRFADFLPAEKLNLIADLADAVEKEYHISRDIKDDVYRIKLTLPGWIIRTNGDKESGSLKWEFDGEFLQNYDALINAESIEIDYINIICLTIALVLLGIMYNYKKKLKKKVNEE